MIKTEAEYQGTIRRAREIATFAETQRQSLIADGFNANEVKRGMYPIFAFNAQVKEEVEWYEAVYRGNLELVTRITYIGKYSLPCEFTGD